MEKNTAISIVRVLSVLQWVGGVFCLLFGLLFIFGGPLLANAILSDPELMQESVGLGMITESMFSFVLIGLGVFFVLLGVLSLFIGMGLWRMRNWGRILAVVTSWISGVWCLFGLAGAFTTGSPAEAITTILTNLFSIAIAGVYIWYLQFEPTVVSLFGAVPSDLTASRVVKPKAKSRARKR
jgi:hypothetical protein